MATGINVSKPIKVLDEGVQITPDVSQINFTGGVTATASGNNVTVNVPAAGITVGTTPVTSGTDTRVFFQAGGVVQQDANFTFDNTQKRLTLRAVGTAATDIPFVVRNSGDTLNLVEIQGTGDLKSRMNAATAWWESNSANGVYKWELGFTGQLPFIAIGGQDGTPRFGHKAVTDNREFACGVAGTRANFALGGVFSQGTVKPNEANNNTLYVFNGTAPALNTTDAFQLYSADRGGTAGKASAHFRAEDGTINVIGDLSGFGTSSPGARLDVRAQGALSTDIAFRVRNSADTANIFTISGNRSAIFNLNNTVVTYFPSGDGVPNNYVDIGLATASYPSIKINATHGGSNFAYFEMNANSLNYFRHNSLLIFQDNTSPNRTSINLQASGGNVGIGTGTFGTSAINTFTMINGTAPSTSPANQFQLYSADIVAGNAAPHFRTEAGDIIKLYRETAANLGPGAGFVNGTGTVITEDATFGGYTIAQIAKALANFGLLQ